MLGPLVPQVLMASLVLVALLVLPEPPDHLVLGDVTDRKVSLDLLELMERG